MEEKETKLKRMQEWEREARHNMSEYKKASLEVRII